MTLLRSSALVVYASALFIAALLLARGSAGADTALELKNDFIVAHKNRATIAVTYSPKFAHANPRPPRRASRPTTATFTFLARLQRLAC